MNRFVKDYKEIFKEDEDLLNDAIDWSILNSIYLLSNELNNEEIKDKIINLLKEIEK
jgi:hypothetical protein